ncbi:hypothetical protein GCM10017781_27930 [Deinococcus metalli]|nr:hypothetical protein GCM10017781_27930 [Deinococcus metalli]
MGCVYPLSYINKQLAAFGAVHNASDSKDLANTRSLEIRFLLWEAAANMFKSRPIIGWGTQSYSMHWFDFLSKEKADKTLALEMGYPRNQKIVRVRDVIYFKDSKGGIVARTQSYDSPHNATLDVLYAQGFLGIATLIWFLIACILAAYRYAGIKGLIGLLPFVGYAIYLQAWFATVPVMGLAIILLGFVLAELRRSHLAPIPQHALRQVPNGHAVTPISTPTGSIHITPSEK